jgi:Ras family
VCARHDYFKNAPSRMMSFCFLLKMRNCVFQPENCITTYEPHAYVVIYSVAEKETMLAAEETLQFLWKSASVGTKAVILVGNKTDLVRSRAVTTDGELVLYF